MRYNRVHLETWAYELGPHVITSSFIEEKLAPLYKQLNIQPGQIHAWTGIKERRWWDPGFKNSKGANMAARKALASTNISPEEIGVFVYAGVCRDNFEPATACEAANGLGISKDAEIFDISNACLGVINGIIHIANKIELGQIKAGMVVSCESARDITEIMISRILNKPTMAEFIPAIATLTGGSGSVAIILADISLTGPNKPRLAGGVAKNAPQFHELCRWGKDPLGLTSQMMETDAVSVLKNGVVLGLETWEAFLKQLRWSPESIDKTICHQVGSAHTNTIMKKLGIDPQKDFTTFDYLGNMGTVSLPITGIIAQEKEFLKNGDKVAFLGIGSGLNCMMLGWEW